jgi:hypothetical protein
LQQLVATQEPFFAVPFFVFPFPFATIIEPIELPAYLLSILPPRVWLQPETSPMQFGVEYPPAISELTLAVLEVLRPQL